MNEYSFLDDMMPEEKMQLFGYMKGILSHCPATTDHQWPELRDPRDQRDAPGFPMSRIPESMRVYCNEVSKGSGFDAGAYAFAALIAVSNLIDHRARLDVGPFSVPPFLWGGILDGSSGGKSPIMGSACRFAYGINKRMLERSRAEKDLWENECRECKRKSNLPKRPPWHQLIVEDITVEGLAELLPDNPHGVFFIAEEFTEFIGRMDAYNSNGKSGKDRGVYLRAWDGKSATVNRVGKGNSYIENFSLGLLAGIQPQKLAEMYRRTETQSDGLFQRFLMYKVAPPRKTNYAHRVQSEVADGFSNLCDSIYRGSREGVYIGEHFKLSQEARSEMERFHNDVRGYCINASSGDRVKEHIGKYPGIVARITLTLHAMKNCHLLRPPQRVEIETYKDAEQIAKVLMTHAMSVYEGIEATVSKSSSLVESACEAILSKGWPEFLRGDLTREATHWRKTEQSDADHALNTLIDFGWITDETLVKNSTGSGRPTKGFYKVNPRVHLEYAEKAQEIVLKRHESFQKLNSLLPVIE